MYLRYKRDKQLNYIIILHTIIIFIHTYCIIVLHTLRKIIIFIHTYCIIFHKMYMSCLQQFIILLHITFIIKKNKKYNIL